MMFVHFRLGIRGILHSKVLFSLGRVSGRTGCVVATSSTGHWSSEDVLQDRQMYHHLIWRCSDLNVGFLWFEMGQ